MDRVDGWNNALAIMATWRPAPKRAKPPTLRDVRWWFKFAALCRDTAALCRRMRDPRAAGRCLARAVRAEAMWRGMLRLRSAARR